MHCKDTETTQNRTPTDQEGTDSMVQLYHNPSITMNQCGSNLFQVVHAPLALVWSMVRRFDNPQAYKHFIKSCIIRHGKGGVGTVRELAVVTGMPANTSFERLERLDDEAHVMVFTIIGGDHRLANYRSTTTLHEDGGGGGNTVVVESYVVDVPTGSTKEDTMLFANTIVTCNLKWLARRAETTPMKM